MMDEALEIFFQYSIFPIFHFPLRASSFALPTSRSLPHHPQNLVSHLLVVFQSKGFVVYQVHNGAN